MRIWVPLAYSLSGEVDRIVLDETGLKGKYDLTLKWTPDEERGAADAGPSIFTAVQEQLGLKLESTTGPVEDCRRPHRKTFTKLVRRELLGRQ